MNNSRLFLTTLLALFIFLTASGQQERQANYGAPGDYTIGGITVSGIKFLDPDILISLSGLSVGDKISVPGDDISNAIKNLWQQGLFTDIKIYQRKTIGSTIFLEISLKERARLSRYAIKGVKKGEAEDIREKITLIKGRVVTENTKITTARTIKEFYAEKGFLNAKVHIREIPDTLLTNSILLEIIVDKGTRIKIESIEFSGNEKFKSEKLKNLMKETNEKIHFRTTEILNKENIKNAVQPNATWRDILGNLTPSRAMEYVRDKTNLNIFKGRSKFIKKEYKSDKNKIISQYNAKGYRDTRIKKDTVYTTDNKIKIEISLDEGNQYYFRNITWSGNTKYPEAQLSRILNIKKGDVYNQTLLDERLYMSPNGTDVSSLYMDDGYLFFQITPVEVNVEDDSIDLEIRIYEGPQATINEVRIYGNTKTKEHVIRREIRTLPGNKFSRADLIRSQQAIVTLGYFDPESMEVLPIPNPEKGTVDIEYHVVEKPGDQLELSAGWGGRGRGVVGTLGISFTNFSIQNMFKKGTWSPLPAGDGQKLSLRVQTNGKIYQAYSMSFTEPWLGGRKPTSFTVSFYNNRLADLDADRNVEGLQKTYGATMGVGTSLKWPDYFSFQTILGYERFKLEDWNSSLFSFSNGASNNLSIQFILSRNSIDKPIYPTRGSNISLSLKLTPPYTALGRKWQLTDTEKEDINDADLSDAMAEQKYKWIEYHKWRFNAEWFVPINKSKKFPIVFRLAAKFGFVGLYNKDIGYSPYERFELGGDGISNIQYYGRTIVSLRGYEVITPSSGAPFFDKFTAELRFPFSLNPSATIYALAFMEGGNYWMDIKNFNPFDLKRSVGLGIRIFLPMFGMLGFDYGIGFDKEVADTGSKGYLGRYGKFSIILGFEPE